MPRKTERRDGAPTAAADSRPLSRDQPALPEPSRRPSRRTGRGDVKNPLGDFAEQVGAFFG